MSWSFIICTFGLLHNPAKVSNFQYRKLYADDEKIQELDWPTVMIRIKSQNSYKGHDGFKFWGHEIMHDTYPVYSATDKKKISLFWWHTKFPYYLFSLLDGDSIRMIGLNQIYG
jgi:hypothetical protein